MAPLADPTTRLVADVGGTNSRLALFDPRNNELRELRHYLNSDHKHFEDTIAAWLQALDEPAPAHCCLAVAAPPFDDVVTMLNVNWSFSQRELAKRFGFSKLRCINDFQGNALSLPHLGSTDLTTLHPGQIDDTAILATVGPGTGLGGSTLDRCGSATIVRACEPGHMGLSPATELELALFSALLPRYGEVYAELLLSGAGIKRLYESLADVRGEQAQDRTPKDISAQALAGQCELCQLALDTFCNLLGSACGDFALANGAYGGLYLAGGIVPQILPLLQASNFEKRFQDKGEMREYLQRVPLYAITSGRAGLLGAAHTTL